MNFTAIIMQEFAMRTETYSSSCLSHTENYVNQIVLLTFQDLYVNLYDIMWLI